MDRAMEYVEKNGIMKDGDYPYKGQTDEACLFNVSESVVKTKGHVFVVTGDEDDLKKAVARQPVTVAINTDYSFQFYQTGKIFYLIKNFLISNVYKKKHSVSYNQYIFRYFR